MTGAPLKIRWIPKSRRKGGKDGHYIIKCGDCSSRVHIYPDWMGSVEINGVLGTIEEWTRLLLPPTKTGTYLSGITVFKDMVWKKFAKKRRTR